MLVKYLLNLRRQPKTVRDRHAFFIASGVTGLILLLWVVTLPSRLESVDTLAADAEARRPLSSLVMRTRDHLAAVFRGASTSTETAVAPAPVVTPAASTTIQLTPEDIKKAQEAAAMPYLPPPTTTPRMVRIATTSTTFATTSSGVSSTSTPGRE